MKWCCYIFAGSSLSRLIICFLVLFWEVPSNTIPPFTKMSLYSPGARMTFQKNSYGSRPECPLRFLFSFVWQSLYIFVWEVPPYTPFLLTVGRFSGVSISPPIGQMEALPHPTLASRRSRKKQKFLASCLFAKKFLHKQAWYICSMFITIHFYVSFLCSWSDLIPIQIVLCKTVYVSSIIRLVQSMFPLCSGCV